MKQLGVLVPIVTPCDRAGNIDAQGLRNVCDDMINAGANAIFVMGSTGRGPWFSLSQHVEACSVAAEHLGPDVPLFAGCIDTGLPRMLESARAMADAGATHAVVTAPAYYKYSDEEVARIFKEFADASPLPVMIYDIPVFAGMKLNLECVLELARHENVIGVKDSSEDFDRFQKLAAGIEELQDVWLIQGKENLLLDSLRIGASGFVVSLMHILPKTFVDLYRAATTGDDARAEELQERITRQYKQMCSCFERRPETSTIFHLKNVLLRQRGVCENLLFEHEGETPDWLAAEAERAVRILEGE